MRIALAHPFVFPEVRRGAERYLEDLSAFLASRGHEVEVISSTKGPRRTEHREDGVTVRLYRRILVSKGAVLGMGPVESFGASALWPLIAGHFDLVHALTPSTALAGRVAGLPTLYSVLGYPSHEQLPKNWPARRLFMAAVRASTLTAVLSQAAGEALMVTAGRQAVVLSPGVRMESFKANLQARRGPPVVLFSGSLSDRRKRVDLAVSALPSLLRWYPDCRLQLSGEGDPSWAFSQGALAQSLLSRIDILGPGRPEEVPDRYRSASVTVLPAENEAFGLVLVESLACGTPVVCTPAGGMPEILGDSGVGRVARSFEPEDIAVAIRECLELAGDPATAHRCVERAYKWAWESAVGPAHEKIYQKIVRPSHTRLVHR